MLSHGKRWKYAFRAFFSLIFHGTIAREILDAVSAHSATPATEPPSAAPPPAIADTQERAAQMLAVLQRDGRLVDFLMEDLSAYSDAQIGTAVRDVHRGCREALVKYATLAPVLGDAEGAAVRLDRPDPSRIKIVGAVTSASPLQGVVRHRGWEVTQLSLPPLPGSGRTIVAPAEVEVA